MLLCGTPTQVQLTFSYSHFPSQFFVLAFIWSSGTIPLLIWSSGTIPLLIAASLFSLPVTNTNTTGALFSATFYILSLLCSVCNASSYCFIETTADFLSPFDILMKITTILWEISNCHQQNKAQLHSFMEAIIQGRPVPVAARSKA